MKLHCTRCNHRWKTKKEINPKVCPKCKSNNWHSFPAAKEVSDTLQKQCQSLIQKAERLDYVTMSPQLLLTVITAFSEAEKQFTGNREDVKTALELLDVIQQLVVAKVLPIEMCLICNRVAESFFRDSMACKEGGGKHEH